MLTGLALVANAGDVQRIGHTTLLPRHSSPDDAGLYAAAIDVTNGYAYVVGAYIAKLDITGNLPVQVGPALLANHAAHSAIDPAGGYLYLPHGAVLRFALGAGANPMTNAGSLSPAFGSAAEMLIDDSDPNPSNHYGYLVCTSSGVPARISKVALSTFTELNSIQLAASESNFLFNAVADVAKGYGYYVTAPAGTNTVPSVVKIKFTPGTNAPVRIGAVNLDTANALIDGGSIDTLHGYAYYGTYNADTNVPGIVYKIRLEDGDVPPTLVGKINLRAGEGRLAASVCDPVNGFVYFADDNTYPGRLYQLSLNGTNLPVEVGYTEMQSTTNAHPPNGVTTGNQTTNVDGVLPYGEVFFRSAVFDPVRGFAYLGQDSRPNQVVKVQLSKIDPIMLSGPQILGDGTVQLSFTNIRSASFSALAAMDVTLPVCGWNSLGAITEVSPGLYQFADPLATNYSRRFYRAISSP